TQAEYLKALEDYDVVFAIGPAGTGKTYLAVAAAVNALRQKKVDRIILVRPAVEAGENLGFLPGDMQEKVDPYLRPMYDALAEAVGQNGAGGAAASGGAPPRESGSDPASLGARASSGTQGTDPRPGPAPAAERGPSL